MVYVLAKRPTVCCVLDDVVRQPLRRENTHAVERSDGNTNTSNAEFTPQTMVERHLAEAIHRIRCTQAPTQLQDALWLLLCLKKETLLSRATVEPKQCSATLRTTGWSERVLGSLRAEKELENLLRQRFEVPPPGEHTKATCGEFSTPSHPSTDAVGSDPSLPLSNIDGLTGLALVEWGLSLFNSPKQLVKLINGDALHRFICDLEALWCWTRLIAWVRQFRRVQLNVAAGVNVTSRQPTVDTRTGRRLDASQSFSGLPLDENFHDAETLLPIGWIDALLDVVRRDAAPETAAAHLTCADLFELCRATGQPDVKNVHAEPLAHPASISQHGIANSSACPPVMVSRKSSPNPFLEQKVENVAVCVSLIINPAWTQLSATSSCCARSLDLEGQRLLKNRRVDAIEHAAMEYYFSRLTTCHAPRDGVVTGRTVGKVKHSLLHADETACLEQPCDGGMQVTVGYRASQDLPVQAAESYAAFLRDTAIGFDIHLMSLSGAGVGYYFGYARGLPTEKCVISAVTGLIIMLLVDATLLLLRIGRQDTLRQKRSRAAVRERSKHSEFNTTAPGTETLKTTKMNDSCTPTTPETTRHNLVQKKSQ